MSTKRPHWGWRRYRWSIGAIGLVIVGVAVLFGGLLLTGPQHTAHAAAAVGGGSVPPVPDPAAVQVRRLIGAHASLREGATNGRLIALTFDDGPGPYTAAIVNELRRLRAPATFFVIGRQIPAYRRLVANMSHWGFVIGDHTWNHPLLTRLSRAQIVDQMASAKNLIDQITGTPVQFMRPPYGAQNARVATLAGRQGLVTTLWSIDTSDWTRPGVSVIVARALAARAGQIILMHDGGGIRTQTVAAIPRIVRTLRARGFRLVTLRQLLALAPPVQLHS